MSLPERHTQVIAAGENMTVEFKRGQRNQLRDDDIVLAAACLANGEGGRLYLGIEDDGSVTGLEPRHGDMTDGSRLRALVLNRTEPPLAVAVELLPAGEGIEIAVLDVPRANTPVGTKSGMFVRRSLRIDGKPECVPFRVHELISRGFSAQGRDYAEAIARGAGWDAIDTAELNRFRARCATGEGDRNLASSSDEEVLRALRVYDPSASSGSTLSVGAILLFGTERALIEHIPTAEALFQEVSRGRITTNESFRLPLLKLFDQLYDRVQARNSEQELMVGPQRIRVPRLPDLTLRESIANALTHRDYAELGPVRVQMLKDEFRVMSPGGFPPGISLANLLHGSKPRSVVLTDAFKRAGLVDRAGSGVEKMFNASLRAGRDGPDYTATNESMVTVTIATTDADLEMVRFVLSYESDAGETLELNSLRTLFEIKSMGPQTVPELSEALDLSEPAARSNLTGLVERGIVEARGAGRHRRHHLTPAFHRDADTSVYVRLQDTDPIQQEQMVMSYVESFGRITRSKAAELCRLSPQQARGVLRRLVEAGQLELRGERRAAHYVRAVGTDSLSPARGRG